MTQAPKTEAQIQAMREGGTILATILADLKNYIQPGMSEIAINSWVESEIARHGATPTYREPVPNFPGVICISVNEQIVHSVPSDYEFEVGDVVSFDLVITYKDMKTDAAFTMIVGEEPKGAKKHLLSVTERSLYAGIDAIKGRGTHTGDIGAAVEKVLMDGKLGVIRELVGHGVGLAMHMEPEIPNYGKKGTGTLLQPGDTIAIEPMATLGGETIMTETFDNWTISTRDGSLAAHFEHTVLITEDGVEILTQL
ncbi:MAG: mapA [Candidatus Saccharibacteria bacterium]|nr:mapA [Candidatus Saccharibacteria bacterium]